jgi:hypothetical protein
VFAPEELGAQLGRAYVDLIEDRGILMSLMQGFLQGHDKAIGPVARAGFLEIYRLLRDEAAEQLLGGLFGDKLDAVVMCMTEPPKE